MSKKLFPINIVPESKTARLYSFLTAAEGYGSGVEVSISSGSLLILALRALESQPNHVDPPAKRFVPAPLA